MPTTRGGAKTQYDAKMAGRAGRLAKKAPPDPSTATTRGKRKKLEEKHEKRRKAFENLTEAPSTPEFIIPPETVTVGSTPTCLAFAKTPEEMKERHAGFLFCSKCHDYIMDYALALNKKSVNRDSRKYKCEGGHTNFIHPTTRIRTWHRQQKKGTPGGSVSTGDDESEDNSDEEGLPYSLYQNFEEVAADDDRMVANPTPSPRANQEPETGSDNDESDCEALATEGRFATPIEARNGANDALRKQVEEMGGRIAELEAIVATNETPPAAPQTEVQNQGREDADRQEQEERRRELERELQSGRLAARRVKELERELSTSELMRQEVEFQLAETPDLSLEVKRLRRLLRQANKAVAAAENDMKNPTVLIEKLCITGITGYITDKKKKGNIRDIVSLTLFDPTFMGGIFRKEMIRVVTDYYKKEVFAPWKILRQMDRDGCKLSLEGLEVVRRVQTNGQKNTQDCILPSSGAVKAVARDVERYGRSIVPYTITNLPEDKGGGEQVSFHRRSAIKAFLQATGLQEAAKRRRVTLPTSCDTVVVTKNVHFMMAGIKVNDRLAVTPLTKRNLGTSLVQSCENSIPLELAITKETKEVVRHVLQDSFDEYKLEDELMDSQTSHILGPGYMPLKMPVNADMSLHWGGLGVGGAAKKKENPCHCCAITSADLAKGNVGHCTQFCQQWKADGKLVGEFSEDKWECYHRPILSEQRVDEIQVDITDLKNDIGVVSDDLYKLWEDSALDCENYDPRVEGQNCTDAELSDVESINFDLDSASIDDVRLYQANLVSDLRLRKLSIGGGTRVLQDRLRKSLKAEFNLHLLKLDLDHSNISKSSALYVVMNALPCILHLENRVGIKLFTRLLAMGLSNNEDRVESYLSDVNAAISRSVLGREDRPISWKVPYDKEKKKITTVSMANGRTRKVVDNMGEQLVPLCIVDPVEREEWSSMLNDYADAMRLLIQHEDLTDDEIMSFQWSIDKFVNRWIRLNQGNEGITNYIHLLAAGHISDYLFKWRNLYRHSQQGWEALNMAVKKYFFRRTNRGGGKKGGTSRLDGVARWLSRRFVWMLDLDYSAILKGLKDLDEGGEAPTVSGFVADEDYVVDPNADV